MSGFYYDTTTPTPTFSWALAAGTLTVSAEGISKMTMEKQGSPGEKIELDISGMSWTIDDDNGSDEFVGRMGTTASRAWGDAMPYFVYLINYDNTPGNVRMGISRDPTARVTPASTDGIGSNGGGAAATPAQTNFFVAYTNNTTLNSKPCKLIDVGLSAICDDSAGGIWTFTAPAAGDCLENTFSTEWTFPLGQNGNEAGKYYNTATPTTNLAFADYAAEYRLQRNGRINYRVTLSNQSAAGNRTEELHLFLPAVPVTGTLMQSHGAVRARITNTYMFTDMSQYQTNAYANIGKVASTGGYTDADFSGASDYVFGEIEYTAF